MLNRMPTSRSRGRPPHADVLTPAEWRVVDAVRHGMTNPQIARRHGVSLDAVKYHVANALLKLSLPTRAELRRWDGVRGDSPMKTRRKTAMPKQEVRLGPLAQIGRFVADLDAARAWYGDVLGLELLYAFPGMAFFRCGDVRLYLHQTDKPEGESILYFRVEDIHAVHRTLSDRGAEFINAPHMIHRHPDGAEEWMAELRDHEGRPLALMAQVRAMADAGATG
jgi:catechol 2,3-dioxygenase-like lactoylglutathione lyase family enzyme/DNA-binding CsgD family transcriptional regulator